MEFKIEEYIEGFNSTFPDLAERSPWHIVNKLSEIILDRIPHLNEDFTVTDGVAIHKSATIEQNVIIKAPAIISEGCFIGANAYLRGGIFLGKSTVVGTSCEVKSSIIFHHSAVAHFNFIGDSIIGSHVNFEAGSITANHYNERADKHIRVLVSGRVTPTHATKFGALVGDNSKVGANAVLSPGTILPKASVVKRLELIQQHVQE